VFDRAPRRAVLGTLRLLILLLLPVSAGLVACGGDCDPEVLTGVLPDGVVGQDYAATLQGGCEGDPVWFFVNGDLPQGLVLLDDGEVVGVPQVAGTFVFAVALYDVEDWEYSDSKAVSLTVRPAS